MNIIHYNQNGFAKTLPKESLDLIVAIDSALVSIHSIELPHMSNTKLKSAIAFKLEDVILTDIEKLEFIPFKQDQKNNWDVVVIAKSILADIKKTLTEACIQPLSIVPEHMLLPYHPGKTSYLQIDDQVLYKNGNNKGGKLQKTVFDQIFPDITQLYKVERFSEATPTISIIAKGEFDLWKHYLFPWRYPAIAMLIVLALSVVQLNHNNNNLNLELQHINQANQSLFKQAFPDIKKVVNMRTQAEQKLALAQQQKQSLSNDFLIALSQKITPGKQLNIINYKDQVLTIKEIK